MEKVVPNIYQVEKSVFAIVGPEGATNFGIVKGEDGSAFLIDADIRRIDEIENALKETSCTKVCYLFNTHENFDHTSANDYFEKNGTIVIGSEGCWKALKEDGEAKFAEMAGRVPELKKRFSDLKMELPQISFGQMATVRLPGFSIRLAYSAYNGKSHSRGDAIAILDQQRILFAGDLLYTEVHPVTIYGNMTNWIQSIDMLLNEEFTYVVPGHGPVVKGKTASKAAFFEISELFGRFPPRALGDKVRRQERCRNRIVHEKR